MHESTLRQRDAPVPAPGSGVTYVMPVLNEEDYLDRAVESVLSQRVDEPMELILALGPSTDGTTARARALADGDDRIRLVENPAAHIPIGLNLAIRAGRYPTIIRVDAHSQLDPDYTAKALETLARTRAANVGGIMRAEGKGRFQRAVARAYNSPIGLGGGAYHGGAHEGPAESAYLGVFRRAVLDEVGLFDESVRRGEDWELNLRIRRAGYRVWFDPQLAVAYWPRQRWTRLVQQFAATGAWRGELVRRYRGRNSLRYFAPGALVITVATFAILTVARVLGIRVNRRLHALVTMPVGAYVALIAAAASGRAGGLDLRDRLTTMLVVPSMHIAWGVGFLRGVLRGADSTIDTSRLKRNTPLP